MAVNAANNPFTRMIATEDNVAGGTQGSHETKENPDALYDAGKLFQLYWDTNSDTWAHNNVNTIAFLDPYGIGYGHERGTIYIENLDFGANGTDKVTVALTNTNEPFSGLGIYLDVNPVKDSGAQPIAVINDVVTDGFEEENAKDYTVDVNIPGGVHTVYFMYLGMDVGSFFSVQFNEAPLAPEPEPEPAAVVDDTASGGGEAADAEIVVAVPLPAPVPETTPKTGDASIWLVILACAVLPLALSIKKHKAKY